MSLFKHRVPDCPAFVHARCARCRRQIIAQNSPDGGHLCDACEDGVERCPVDEVITEIGIREALTDRSSF